MKNYIFLKQREEGGEFREWADRRDSAGLMTACSPEIGASPDSASKDVGFREKHGFEHTPPVNA